MKTREIGLALLALLVTLAVGCSSDSPTDVLLDDDLDITNDGGSTVAIDDDTTVVDNGNNPDLGGNVREVPREFRGEWGLYAAVGEWESPNLRLFNSTVRIDKDDAFLVSTAQDMEIAFDEDQQAWVFWRLKGNDYRIEGRQGDQLNITLQGIQGDRLIVGIR
ncbi:MAG: hypothetical protein HOJ15_04130 [Candidatus Jacksonbacteria bacterium]|jgi:hypothetical protein|nr:hypothetical protein [Candidatus Jacksonbacteria bacterium]MBT6301588.1 hypothetical protein [Candidatus Jacksonbacteria bacterium]MBT6757015.1 hypothetical protein [Candidatus Jacksonbacteria bacterium]MBT6955229.1 hypothetical protein [Candidatus Jacksonbacteria bacterium]MBT7007875.1 hypothetical protein [Candidatus Jacksonbacteria bacterium]